MTIGISKKYLESIINEEKYGGLLSELISKCIELNPWIPIDENTPKDRRLLLYSSCDGFQRVDYAHYNDIAYYAATHYCELLENPK